MSDYNYERFDEYVESGSEQIEFAGFFAHLRAGSKAPDFVATRLDDRAEVQLSTLWQRKPLVIEFGSFT